MTKKLLTTSLLSLFFLTNAEAGVSPLSIALAPGFQFPSQESTVAGVRLSILWGSHKDVYGVDFGFLGNVTDKEFGGSSFAGIFNKTGGASLVGLQMAGIVNLNSGNTSLVGFQAAPVNVNGKGQQIGFQLALANLCSDANFHGLQLGIYNTTAAVYGLQIGIVNVTKSLHGVQLGLLNFAKNGMLPFFPFLNVGF